MSAVRCCASLFVLLLLASTVQADVGVYIWKDDPSYTRARIAEKYALWFAFGSMVLALVFALFTRARRIRLTMLAFVGLLMFLCLRSPMIFSVAGGGASFEGDTDWKPQVVDGLRVDDDGSKPQQKPRDAREYLEPGGRRITLNENIVRYVLLSGFICFGGLALTRLLFGSRKEPLPGSLPQSEAKTEP